jgi:hypothetical protein
MAGPRRYMHRGRAVSAPTSPRRGAVCAPSLSRRHRVGAIKLPFRPSSPFCAAHKTHPCIHQAGAIKLPKDLAAPSMLFFRGLSIKQN